MKIAIICPFNNTLSIDYSIKVINFLKSKGIKLYLHKDLMKSTLIRNIGKEFWEFDELNENVDFLISIGGDGSMLKAVTVVKDTNIPILGINTGRLGFLTSLGKESIELGLNHLLKSEFKISKRCLLEVYSNKLEKNFFGFNYALNEVSVSRKNTASLISISAELNGIPLATYWADGLIIATPTGSTGYSLSSGGPVMTPESSSLVLTPIAAHNINIRPLIVNDNTIIKLCVTGRGYKHLISLDSRILTVPLKTDIFIKKADFSISKIEINKNFFINTLREKLFWGLDKRN
ncbi:MAG: NAD kinase [Flavobacteriaceae bacterium]|nr:NAD kinase [Flavobacteriaceae bacterium]